MDSGSELRYHMMILHPKYLCFPISPQRNMLQNHEHFFHEMEKFQQNSADNQTGLESSENLFVSKNLNIEQLPINFPEIAKHVSKFKGYLDQFSGGSKNIKEEKMKNVLNEFSQYERRLLESLRILKLIGDDTFDKYDSKDAGTAHELRDVFKDVAAIYSLHKHINDCLKAIAEGTATQILPSTFLNEEEIPQLNIYKNFLCRYANNYPKLAAIVSKQSDFANLCRSHIASSEFPEQQIQDVCGMYFGVHSSITRIKMLISKMKEQLSDDDIRSADVQKALKVIDDLLLSSEGEMVRQDQIMNAQIVCAKMDGLFINYDQISPLIRVGSCKKIPRRSLQKPAMDRYLFLFTDYLVLTELPNGSGRFQVKSQLPLSQTSISDIDPDDVIKIPNGFRITAVNLCVELIFSSPEERHEWFDDIQNTIAEHRKNYAQLTDYLSNAASLSAAEWVKDEQATMCAGCCAEFTVFNRRHHCRACGQVFCGICSNYQAPIAFLGGKLQRVCFTDYGLITGGASVAKIDSVRAHKLSSSVESGYLFWCFYNQGLWNFRPISRSTVAVSHIKYERFHLSEKHLLPPLNSVMIKANSNDANSRKYCVHYQSTPTVNSDFANTVTAAVATDKISQDDDHTIASKPSTFINLPICLSRVFCVLYVDTLFSMFAARADIRPKDKLPLLGTRMIYLDDAPWMEIAAPITKNKSASCCSLPRCRSHKMSDLSSKSSHSTSSIPSPTSSRCGLTSSTSDSITPAAMSQMDASETAFKFPSPGGNPIYRNFKPPPLPPKPVLLTSAKSKKLTSDDEAEMSLPIGTDVMYPVEATPKMSPLQHTTFLDHIDEPKQVDAMTKDNLNEAERIKTKHRTKKRKNKSKKRHDDVFQFHNSPNATKPTDYEVKQTDSLKQHTAYMKRNETSFKPYALSILSEEATLQQLKHISPDVLRILRNRLSFVLLPMHSDSIAHYFEAPSVEVRVQWINAIVRVCREYLTRES